MSPQQTIAHYRITAKLGEGGMGTVYRATDTKLNRDVAIKVLPDAFAADPDRLARFTREAQVLASMNHPNIAAIHGVEERALILELVEGPTLAERIAQGPMPPDEAIAIARQIAEALEYAHERGIVHRDLKPANVKVTPEGQVKVLDFGLAKALTPELAPADPASSPTMTMRATMAGVLMGTAGYMSPEQAKGKPVDRRADIWAFGVVLGEMLLGRPMYPGEAVTEILGAVLLKEPEIPVNAPAHVRALLRRCLEKDPRERLQAIGEARIALARPALPEPAAPAAIAAASARRGAPWWMLAAAAVVPAAILGGLLWRATRPVDRPLEQFSADLGPDALAGARTTAVISRDGTRIAFPVRSPGGTALATRLMAHSKATVLAGTENGLDPFFSPDGQWLGFFSHAKLLKVSVLGGATVTLCDASTPRGAAWGEDGFIYGTFDGAHLSRVPAAGGTPEILTEPQKRGERTDRMPQMLPGGELILVTVAGTSGTGPTPTYDEASIGVYSLKSRQVKIVQRGGYFGRYLPSGHLMYIHQGTMFAVPFDLKRLQTRGMPVPVLESVAAAPGQAGGQFDFSENGTLVYLSGTTAAVSVPLLWMDKTGKEEQLMPEAAARPLTPRLSPDGKLLAFSMNGDIYVYDPARSATSRLTFDPVLNSTWPVWAPDGKHIAYTQGNNGIWWVRSDGSGKAEVLYDSKASAVPTSISPDGKVVVFHQSGKGRDIYTLALDLADPDHPKPGKPEPFLVTEGQDVEAAFSPDGRWLAYQTNASGNYHVFVRPFPEGAQGGPGQAQISSAPGRFPIWSRTGKEIFYLSADGHIMVVPYVVNGRAFLPGKPAVWSGTAVGMMGVNMPLDLAPDGKRFVVLPGSDASAGGDKANLHVTFLLNFFDELKRRVP
jgi:serine/threonine-protein kinase